MAVDLAIAQAIVLTNATGPSLVAHSGEFGFSWEEAVLTIAARFGTRPAGIACPEAIFAIPFERKHVAVVTVADQKPGEADSPLGFRFLILGKSLYEALGNPFAIADAFPPRWENRGTLDPLKWEHGALPPQTVDEIAKQLQAGDTALLLGTTQTLLDGGRVILTVTEPDPQFFRTLWQLLPIRSRFDIWPATFAFSADLGWHCSVLPTAPQPWPIGHLTADQARDYPEGRYELAIQSAIESSDQVEFDRLLTRRSTNDTLRLAAYMIVFALFAAIVSKFF
ncbi:MAG: hypothetical protein LC104_10995 [Bacteroidales bacterium]|nr:hypothetical protein [Bacteroidales bacterium]